MVVDRLQQQLVGHGLAPVGFDLDHICAVAPGDLCDASAKEAGTSDDRGLARLQQVGDSGLHARHAGAVQREDEPVGHAVDASQHRHDLEQDLVHVRIEVTEHRPAHGREHRRFDVGRARTAQEALRRVDRRQVCAHSRPACRRARSHAT
jgi:hypothetical protein